MDSDQTPPTPPSTPLKKRYKTLASKTAARVRRARKILAAETAAAQAAKLMEPPEATEDDEDETPPVDVTTSAPKIRYVDGQPLPDVTGLARPERQLAWVLAAQRGNRAAAELLIKSVDGLIYAIVQSWAYGSGNSEEEAFVEMAADSRAFLLERAISAYDPAKGASWATVAFWHIKSACSTWVEYHSRTVHVPVNLKRQKRALAELCSSERELTDEEICAALEISPKRLEAVRTMSDKRAVSLDAPLNDDSDALPLDLLTYSAESVTYEAERELLPQALSELLEIERFIVEQRFYAEKTLLDVGAALGVSRERVRQLEVKAIKKLRKALVSRRET